MAENIYRGSVKLYKKNDKKVSWVEKHPVDEIDLVQLLVHHDI